MGDDRFTALDTRLFEHIPSSTTEDDRRSLLALHDSVAAGGRLSYLEIGSHLGGSLQPALVDPRCVRIVSIDPRPQAQPDDRPNLAEVAYEGNSTERMLENLRGVPGADLSKLETFEASTEELDPETFAPPDLCFIDGEHTNEAALRDARFCRAVMRGRGVIAFHDSYAVEEGILAFLREAPRPHRAYSLRSSVFVVELGVERSPLDDPRVRGQLYRVGRSVLANRLGCDTALLRARMLARQVRERRRLA
jgi:predicted O-methyltransferase YrrM